MKTGTWAVLPGFEFCYRSFSFKTDVNKYYSTLLSQSDSLHLELPLTLVGILKEEAKGAGATCTIEPFKIKLWLL